MMHLLRSMLVNQSSFLYKRIDNKKYAEVFNVLMLDIINMSSHHEDLISFKNEFEIQHDFLLGKKPVLSFFDETYKYKKLALELTLDIISSLDTRFVSGGSKTYLSFFDTIE